MQPVRIELITYNRRDMHIHLRCKRGASLQGTANCGIKQRDWATVLSPPSLWQGLYLDIYTMDEKLVICFCFLIIYTWILSADIEFMHRLSRIFFCFNYQKNRSANIFLVWEFVQFANSNYEVLLFSLKNCHT